MAALHALVSAAFFVLLVTAAGSDLRRFEIPNAIPLALLALYPAFVLTAPVPLNPMGAIAAAIAVFLAGIALFMGGLFGGGDVKLLAAVSLWCGANGLADLLFVTGVTGGLLALILLIPAVGATIRRLQTIPAGSAYSALKHPMPYGVAIAIGGILTVLSSL